jgi:hypothetical protein
LFNPATIRVMYSSTATDRRKIGRAFADGKGCRLRLVAGRELLRLLHRIPRLDGRGTALFS